MTWIREVYIRLIRTKVNIVFTSEIILGEDVEDHRDAIRRDLDRPERWAYVILMKIYI